MPTASRAKAAAAGLATGSRKRDSDHDFSSCLAWEKESEEGNAFRALERGAGNGEGGRRRGAARWRRQANATTGRGEEGGKQPERTLTPRWNSGCGSW
jgi:hypothetical protein